MVMLMLTVVGSTCAGAAQQQHLQDAIEQFLAWHAAHQPEENEVGVATPQAMPTTAADPTHGSSGGDDSDDRAGGGGSHDDDDDDD